MTVSKINFVCSDFSYAPQIVYGSTGQLRNASWFDVLKKILVTGGDPLVIESITVLNKVVRVVTAQKNFVSVIGAKFDIAGTGVTAIDTRQEASVIFTDGFSFNLDTPNATFSSGLTYSFSALGWQLLDQDANRLLLRSGNGAVTPFNLLISREMDRSNTYTCLCHYINYSATNLKDIVMLSPNKVVDEFFFPSRYEGGLENSKTMYWIYGDDAIVYVSSGSDVIVANPNNFMYTSLMCVGETKGLNNGSPVLFRYGRHVGVLNTYDFGGNSAGYISSPFGYTNWLIATPDNQPVYAGNYFTKVSRDVFTTNRSVYVNSFVPIVSGTKTTSYKDIVINNYSFLATYLLNDNCNKIGQIPGLYYLDFNVNIINPLAKNTVGYKLVLDGKIKNTVIVRYGSQDNRIDVTQPSNLTSVMFDLTGPIR